MKDSDFCKVCKYYLYLDQDDKTLRRICRNCGYQEEDKKGGLILEIDLKEKTSEGYKILMNEFTKQDPTLPHVNTIKCFGSSKTFQFCYCFSRIMLDWIWLGSNSIVYTYVYGEVFCTIFLIKSCVEFWFLV